LLHPQARNLPRLQGTLVMPKTEIMKQRAERKAARDKLEKRYEAKRAALDQAWDRVRDGRYEEAMALLEAYMAKGDEWPDYQPPYGQRGLTRLLIGDYVGAAADFRAERQLRPEAPSRHSRKWIGVALWLAGAREAACADWVYEIELLRSKQTSHTDEAGGIGVPALLWWASSHEDCIHWRDQANAAIKHLWSKSRACRESLWPGSLAPYLLGKITDLALLVAASDPNLEIQARHCCQAQFYIGAAFL